MRIIGGLHKGRRLKAPAKLPVRPTTDRAKEALFNWLEHRFELSELSWLDLFAGTGNMSLEAASRGCQKLMAVDKHPACCRFIRETAKLLELPIEVIQADVFQWLDKSEICADIIFADPPYNHPELRHLPKEIGKLYGSTEGCLFILEHPATIKLHENHGFLESRVYGQSVFSIFDFGIKA